MKDTVKPKGNLTVFLGAAPGVGKTYTMLEAAQQRLQEGHDVVVAWANTHGMPETERLLAELPQIPLPFRNPEDHHLPEMDIDAILNRRPELVLVDDLSHTNIPGSRHVRRFQDIEEILKAGIDVYTTLNIQHIESLNDIVTKITGVIVNETVPDHILENADSVQLIDIPSEELLKRLKEGKVNIPPETEPIMRKFFRPGNINALREMSLRFTANRVDKDLSEYMVEHKIEGPWPAAERVMVCVSASPFSAQLIRAARRLAAGIQAELLAVHIEAPARRFPVGDKERDRVARNMRLAEDLGAKTLTIIGKDLVQEIIEVACAQNVSAIVIGKPQHSRLWELWHGSLVDKLIRHSGGINIYVIRGAAEQDQDTGIRTTAKPEGVNWRQYFGGLAMITLATLFSLYFLEKLELINIALLYQLPVVMSAFWWGRWPSYFAALCGLAAFDFLFVPPTLTFSVADIRYLWSFITFLIMAFVIGGRTELLRREATSARQREISTRALYQFSREIAGIIDLDLISQELVKQAADTLGSSVLVMLPDSSGQLSIRAASHAHPDGSNQLSPNPTEMAAARWSFEHAQVAGRSTDTLSSARYLYTPLKTNDNIVGVLGIYVKEKNVLPEEKRLIDAWAGLAAIAVERVKLAAQAREASLLLESDRLRTALFNSISHELRTPLSSIIGSVSTLVEAEKLYSEAARHELLETIQDGAARMERIIANLLDTARLESGMMQLKIDWCDIEDIIGASLNRLRKRTERYILTVKTAPDIPMMKADCVLLEQVLVNIIDNAMKYSPDGSEILISAKPKEAAVLISVSDNGIGIPAEDLTKIFDKFYRIQQPKHVSGTGLGLSICKGIVEAHGGVIWAERKPGGGSTISFQIPVGEKVVIPERMVNTL
ncbi:sensor histidine kinase [Sporomusa acidovorans]|uniref:histidine kinase n=1 Tax=Sporomusa acidovorans (strain ATCC 49682 / DSM 3132 / Mol) TaxID=1123286 RepID=A0ABZ3J6D7_SPOA4|nr:sensor histidine kinase KdpD [Sporomusa acidovorans]OZC15376.1 sensor protein KdpD [Sporomusa acidovorans DSM 3132]SDF13873.1 two-component system, OmpR family, sensor histidine kinase KdpD [Sporomusa acidovorans]